MDKNSKANRLRRVLACAQGAYYVIGGLWPLVHLTSFEAVTGNKRDEWLVRTVAGILLVLGSLLLHDALVIHYIARTLRILAGGIALVLCITAVVSSLTGRISGLYLLDGLVHGAFVIGWMLLHGQRPIPRSDRPTRRS